MSRFKVGDRVRYSDSRYKGKVFTVGVIEGDYIGFKEFGETRGMHSKIDLVHYEEQIEEKTDLDKALIEFAKEVIEAHKNIQNYRDIGEIISNIIKERFKIRTETVIEVKE